jgi:hypothetical protein
VAVTVARPDVSNCGTSQAATQPQATLQRRSIVTELVLIDGLGKILSHVVKLLERRETKTNERLALLQELFDDFLVIHRNYVTLFMLVRNALLIDIHTNPDKKEEVLAEVRRVFGLQRLEYDGLRTKLRAMAQGLVRSTDDPAERRFLWAIICYFLEHERPNKSFRDLDLQAKLTIEQGKDAVLSTPSSYILGLLTSDKDPDKIGRAVESIIGDLNGYLSDVTNTFTTLKLQVHK